ncbi:hypothetical protein CEXT_772471 [Caerostris extrusa]|uniref:Uncharacterized protein n=1 Tax=Caerostris extrusa TaxID=172846 RepID=A0AAV4NZB8_CAEEX|nr:hypothetical protein CEXT_772471 [Caerostris extrusa]
MKLGQTHRPCSCTPSKHFLSLHALHWFLWVLSIGHLPFRSPCALHVYTRLRWMLRLKNPEQPAKEGTQKMKSQHSRSFRNLESESNTVSKNGGDISFSHPQKRRTFFCSPRNDMKFLIDFQHADASPGNSSREGSSHLPQFSTLRYKETSQNVQVPVPGTVSRTSPPPPTPIPGSRNSGRWMVLFCENQSQSKLSTRIGKSHCRVVLIGGARRGDHPLGSRKTWGAIKVTIAPRAMHAILPF